MTDPTPTDATPPTPAAEPLAPAPATPPAPAPPAAATSTWAAAPPPAQAGPVGLVYADVPNRVIAYIIDIFVVAVIAVVVGLVLAIVGITTTSGSGLSAATNWVGSIILTFVGLAISGAYFVYSWTRQRATLGMKALGLQVGAEPNGATITTDQAIRRWLALGAIFSIAQILTPLPFIGVVIGLASIAWVIFLLYTTANSPTKQGWHDVFAKTMIVKAARNVA